MAKILVVDDSSVIRELLTEYLGELGHQVDTASDGQDGLAKARSGGYDICICDLHLPGKNGYQLLKELGKDRHGMEFVFTDSLPDELYDMIQSSTEFTCLRKPFGLEQLRDVIEKGLEKARVK
ncbi:MAG: response regulator [Candidatus Zixiibacteriota bacterium]